MPALLRFAKEPRVESGLLELTAGSEKRLDPLKFPNQTETLNRSIKSVLGLGYTGYIYPK